MLRNLGKKLSMTRYRFASKEEARMLIHGNTQYYNRLSQMDIDWRARKAGATLEELKAFAQEQVLDFTLGEIKPVLDSVGYIEHKLKILESHLPFPEEIVFVKTTMKDESDASGYTSGNLIFLNAGVLQEKYPTKMLDILIAHELFHCITRHSPKFLKEMYALIGFTVMDHDIEFPEHVRRVIMANPDVEHIDSYAEFTINGEKRKCTLLPVYVNSWADAYASQGSSVSFFNNIGTVLAPLDDQDNPLDLEDASDFWDKMGHNTDYVTAPEECLAVNFSYAIVFGKKRNYKSPQLIEGILDTLKNFKE